MVVGMVGVGGAGAGGRESRVAPLPSAVPPPVGVPGSLPGSSALARPAVCAGGW